jgi:hypothetical protein
MKAGTELVKFRRVSVMIVTYRDVAIVHDDLTTKAVGLVGKDTLGGDGMIPNRLPDPARVLSSLARYVLVGVELLKHLGDMIQLDSEHRVCRREVG